VTSRVTVATKSHSLAYKNQDSSIQSATDNRSAVACSSQLLVARARARELEPESQSQRARAREPEPESQSQSQRARARDKGRCRLEGYGRD